MAVYYKWLPGSRACERCKQLATKLHKTLPRKPHFDCVCTWIKVDTNSTDTKECDGPIIIQRIQSLSGGNNTVEDGRVTQLNIEFEVTGICPDNTVMTIHLSVVIEGETNVKETHDRIDNRMSEDGMSFEESIQHELESMLPEVRSRAMRILRRDCKQCTPKQM